MNIYVWLIVFIFLVAFIFRDNNPQSQTKFLRFAFFALFFLMAFRDATRIGWDSSSSYYEAFLKVEANSFDFGFGIAKNLGLFVIMKTVLLFTHDYQWVIILSAIWVCYAFYRLLKKYSENVFISIMWFLGMLFYTFLFSALKQAWAMAFLCFAFDAVIEKKKMRFFFFVGLATIFHFPALIFLPAYWIAKLKVNKTFPILMAVLLVVVFTFRSQILNYMTSAYNNGESEYFSEARFFQTKFVLMLLILAYGFFGYFKYHVNNPVFNTLLYYMGIAAAIQTFCVYDNIFERLADYYYVFSILFMPMIIRETALSSDSGVLSGSDEPAKSNSVLYHDNARVNYFNSISVGNILAVVITVFCVWRFLSITTNDVRLCPFYFFWQNY